ncbi:Rpn family recombination-promoting nuclease/putative transposase [Neopusillimonas aromaticivorans]|uniref:Rpn family recombination-promoting nuclease/putative transposase n=1 Tax=Neopusillimonas aromaticivorans TaxID=2979868 RepID=UPI00259366E0|nr:Rpn family recombination-promoting nuclease/putative transposase [Neopusillimonas aromaticivorans]WJJ93529.1 Rpn family recombination-promoting nuclease/putative transposase [Neopusillimonas aromaticivorans]
MRIAAHWSLAYTDFLTPSRFPLQEAPGSYITDDLRQRADDVIWRVRADGQWVYLYLLIEFQSESDPWMPVRMMVYVGLLYQDLIRRGDVLPGNRLPPVLPIVLYNGAAPGKPRPTSPI